jgi:hypothetical protein
MRTPGLTTRPHARQCSYSSLLDRLHADSENRRRAGAGARHRYVLAFALHVADLDTTWFQIGFAIDAASFSPDGRRLLVFGDELVVISVTDRAIVWRAALGELSA